MPDLLRLWESEDLKDVNKNKPVLHILEEKYVTVLDPYILTFYSLVYIISEYSLFPPFYLCSFCSLFFCTYPLPSFVLYLSPSFYSFFCFEVYLYPLVRSYRQNGVAGKRTTLPIRSVLRVSYFGDHAGNLCPDPP